MADVPQGESALFPDVPEADPKEPGTSDPVVKDFIRVIQDFQEYHSTHLSEVESLIDERDGVANVDDPRASNKRTNQSIMHKATIKLLKQMELPAFKLEAAGATQSEQALTQSLFEDAAEQAGWRHVITGKKRGAQRDLISTGDAFVGGGVNPNPKAFPYMFWNESVDAINANLDATEMKTYDGANEVRKWVVLKEYQWETAISFYPELIGNATLGLLPQFNSEDEFETELTQEQESAVRARKIQMAFCYDLDYSERDEDGKPTGDKGMYAIIAGGNAFKLQELTGTKFPWKDRQGQPKVNYRQLIGFPRQRGLFNYGVLQIVKKLADMHSVLENMGITYTLSNSNPVRIVATSQTNNDFAKDFQRAQRDGKEGKMPIMVNKDGKEFGGITTTRTEPIINELNAMLEIIEKDLAQFGININDLTTSTAKTLGALQLEVQASSDLVKYIQQENAPFYADLLSDLMEYLVGRKKDDSDITLSANVKIRDAQGKEQEINGIPAITETGEVDRDVLGNVKSAREFNLEDLKQTLKKRNWKITVSGGVVNNPVLEDAQMRDIIATSDPTSKASTMTKALRAQKLLGMNLQPEDFLPAQLAQQPTPIPNEQLAPLA